MTFISTKKLESTILGELTQWFKGEGFEKKPPCSVNRWRDNFFVELSCTVNKVGGSNRCNPWGVIGFRDCGLLWAALHSSDPEFSLQRAVNLQVDYRHLIKDWNAVLTCDQKEDIPRLLGALHQCYIEELLPLLLRYSDPRILAKAYVDNMNDTRPSMKIAAINKWSTALSALILVRLHLPEGYVSMKNRLRREFFDSLIPMVKEPTERTIEFLDQESMSPEELVEAAEKILQERLALLRR